MKNYFKKNVPQYLIYLLYAFNLILMVNFLALNARFSNTHFIFLSSLLVVVFAYLYRHYFSDWLRFAGALPLVLDYCLVYSQTAVVFNQILPSLIGLTCYIYFKSGKKYYVLLVVSLLASAGISYRLYPQNLVQKVKYALNPHDLGDFTFRKISGAGLKLTGGKCTIVETLGKKCGQCVEAMRDLGPFFEDMEKKYGVQFVYVHIGKGNENDIASLRSLEVVNVDSLYYDADKLYYQKTGMVGFPYFNFYDKNGKYISSLEGYNKQFQELYMKEVEEVLLQNSE